MTNFYNLPYKVGIFILENTPCLIFEENGGENAATIRIIFRIGKGIKCMHVKQTFVHINNNAVRSFYDVVVDSYEESAKIFSNKKSKSSMVGKTFTTYDLAPKLKCRIDGIERDCVLIMDGTSKQRFLLSDVKFVLNINVKGILPPKNRLIRNEISVVCKDDKHIRGIKRGDVVKVVSIFSNTYAGNPYVIAVKTEQGAILKVKAKHFKVL